MDTQIQLLILAIIYVIHIYINRKTEGYFSAGSIFMASQMVFFYGTAELIDTGVVSELQYKNLNFLSTMIFMVTYFSISFLSRHSKIAPIKSTNDAIKKSVILLYLLSVLITALYYYSVGYSTLIVGINSFLAGEKADVATLRLESYAGSRYLFPGYVNQFKNVILPSLSLYIILVAWRKRLKYRHTLYFLIIPSAIISLLGTGQRGAFVTFFIVILATLFYYNRSLFKKALYASVFTLLPLFFLSSVVLNRSNIQQELANDLYSGLSAMISELFKRFFEDNQLSGLYGYRYIEFKQISIGSEWIQGLTGILPGANFKGSRLSNEIFALLYGSDRGTSPISLWGSVYYNFRFSGTILIPAVMAVIYRLVFIRVANLSFGLGTIISGCGIMVTLGMWISDGPISLLNNGLPAYILLFAMFRRIEGSK